MLYRQSIEGCLSTHAGGLTEAEFTSSLEAADSAAQDLREEAAAGRIGFLDRLADAGDLDELTATADVLRSSFRKVVIFGTGGSSLGGQALVGLARLSDGDAASPPHLTFVDTVDPDVLVPALSSPYLGETAFVAISKSGATTETLAQLMLVIDAFRSAGRAAGPFPITVVTEPGDNPMQAIAARHGLRVLPHPPYVGGRFSALTVTGLLPAMAVGLDGRAIRDGARQVAETLMAGPVKANPPVVGAALSVALLRQRGCAQSVLMPYGERLRPLAAWWRQLWAESLGKAGLGSTPIDARGPADQHSQLQLYLDGPADKMFTVLSVAHRDGDMVIAEDLTNQKELGYLGGRSLSDILSAMCRATTDTLSAHGRPVREIRLTRLDEAAMGALMMHFMIETVIAARLLGVDPFDQPAVEDGKLRARAYLETGSSR